MKKGTTPISKLLKFWVSTFIDKELTLFAASLSFYTIFTIIPLIIIFLTFLTSMSGFEAYYESIKTFIFSNLMPMNSQIIIKYIDGFLANSAKMGIYGLLTILVSSLLFFKNFEFIANKIFNAPKRSFLGSFRVYLTMTIVTPLGLGVSFYITGYIASLMASNSFTQDLNILFIFPYLIIWGLFFLIFQISANTKVNIKASLISSLIIAVVFNLSKNAFVYYIFINKFYTSMYGSFASIMFLFFWIYISWIIFIYGLKLCHIIDGIYKNHACIKE